MATDAFRPMSLAGHIKPAQAARRERAILAIALADKSCACGDPAWHVTSTQGRTRYIECQCGRTNKVVLAAQGSLQGL